MLALAKDSQASGRIGQEAMTFYERWHEAATTSAGFFWMALWAFVLGYVISSFIQVLVTRDRMQKTMGKAGARSVALGTFFGFISSSCSFAALSTTRALFKKGAGLVPSMAFLLASTNLVIELGIVIAIFLGWQFVVGEYVGGVLLILFAWLLIRVTNPKKLIEKAREKAEDAGEDSEDTRRTWKQKLKSRKGWMQIGETYVGEWRMVWKDVLIGFTLAGVISAFVPTSFFETLFVGSGGENAANPGFGNVVLQTLVGPVAAFFTFIGSMGNIPLAALLFSNGVSFAGVMAFIFSDLVVFPVLRINASYYGWKMALYILAVLLACLVAASLTMHYALAGLGYLPDPETARVVSDQEFFKWDYTTYLNIAFLFATAGLGWLAWHAAKEGGGGGAHDHGGASLTDQILRVLAVAAAAWLLGGWFMAPAIS